MLKIYLNVMKALSDRTRVKIIKMLQGREMCAYELQAVLQLAQPSVSKPLKLLEEAIIDDEMIRDMEITNLPFPISLAKRALTLPVSALFVFLR